MNQTIAIGSDHAGFALKESLVETLTQLGYAPIDLGTNGPDSVDYPDFAHAVAGALGAGEAGKGVLICGSGIGISMAANRHPDVRAALVHDALGARMCRQHNDANVIVFGGRMIGIEVARDCLEIFLKTEFEGGRHQRRIDKITPA
jgi:ribose 5-phosphate isomerase B